LGKIRLFFRRLERASVLDRIRVVLVNTSHPGNIGGAARAMKNMGLSALAGIEYDGVVGKIKFDDKGDVLNGAITVYQVKGGKWEVMGTVGGAAAPAPAAAPAEEKKQ
jgi:hypothetical protein